MEEAGLNRDGDIALRAAEAPGASPGLDAAFDIDPVQAAATRRRVFDQVASDGQAVAGMHMHFPGLLHLARRGEGYHLLHDGWYPAM